MSLPIKYSKTVSVLFMVSILWILMLPIMSTKAMATEKKKAVIVVIDDVTLAELKDGSYPTIHKLFGLGAVGLMNTNSGGDLTPESAYLTIGAGSRINGPLADQSYNTNEYLEGTTAGEIYKRRTGLNPPTNGIINIGLAPIILANKKLKYDYTPGLLGQYLHQNGLKTAAFGNADTDKGAKRQIASIVMDDSGIVDYGDVSNHILLNDYDSVVGKRTDYEKLLNFFNQYKTKADLIALELGDTSRVDSVNKIVLNNVLLTEKKNALARADYFLSQLIEQLNFEQDMLIVVTPSPSAEAINAQNILTPLIIVGPGIKPGFATSASTKRQGIITNTDISATVLNFFTIKPPTFIIGQPINSIAGTNVVEKLVAQNKQIVHTFVTRAIILPFYRNMIIYVVLLIFAAFVFKYKFPIIFKPFLLAIMNLPLAILLLPLLPQINIASSVGEFLLIVLGLTFLSWPLAGKTILRPIIIIGLLTSLVLDLDVMLGSPLIKISALGYDPMSGARFYGIGNEYMGVLIGAMIIGLAALLQHSQNSYLLLKGLIALLFIGTTYIMIAPTLGTNAGGTIAAIAGFVVAFLLWNNISLNKKNVSLTLISILTLTIVFISIETFKTSAVQSHIGRTISLVKANGAQTIVDIIIRKETVNFNLITKTQWSWLYLINLIPALYIIGSKKYAHLKQKYPILINGVIATIVSSLVALIFNDSGIVAASTMVPFATISLLLIATAEKQLK